MNEKLNAKIDASLGRIEDLRRQISHGIDLQAEWFLLTEIRMRFATLAADVSAEADRVYEAAMKDNG